MTKPCCREKHVWQYALEKERRMKLGVSLQSVWLGRCIARGAGTWDVRKRILETEGQIEKGKPLLFLKKNTSQINATFCLALMKQINKAIGAHMATEISLD